MRTEANLGKLVKKKPSAETPFRCKLIQSENSEEKLVEAMLWVLNLPKKKKEAA